MSDTVIRVENLGKCYQIAHQANGGQRERYTALRDVIAEKTRGLCKKLRCESRKLKSEHDPTNQFPLSTFNSQLSSPASQLSSSESFWALRDVSFDIQRGEVVGIIGRNGAGKSTLLKILSRITEPTTGRVGIKGRVASLLEVGTGFHPELTGRENIYLNGAILGMTREEITRKFDEIVAFAEVEKFLDTPVKRYSSGMYVRLAFAVAAHLEPEILIVDEVLAVGDAEFQKKCLGKIKSVANTDGRCVLFVSHNMAAIQTLCCKGILLRQGCVAGMGDTNSQIESYLRDASHPDSCAKFSARSLARILTLDQMQFAPNPVQTGSPVEFSIQIASTEPAQLRELALLVSTPLGTRIAIVDLRSARGDNRLGPERAFKVGGRIRQLPLVEGEYSIGLYLNCADFKGNVYDLTRLMVNREPGESDLPPYSPHDRGVLELCYDFQRE